MSVDDRSETLGGTSDEPPPSIRTSKQAKEIAGKSPTRIAFGRLAQGQDRRRLRSWSSCFFVLIAIFAGADRRRLRRLAPTTLLRQPTYLDLSTGLPMDGPAATTASTPSTRSASRRAPATTTWPTGSTAAAPR